MAAALELALDQSLALRLGEGLDVGDQRAQLLAARGDVRGLGDAVVVLVEVLVDRLVAKVVEARLRTIV